MNGSRRTEAAWPPSRWLAFVVGVFVLQIALIWALGDRRFTSAPVKPFGMSVALLPEINATTSASEAHEPAFLALPNVRGFSGEAWLKYQPPAHQLAEWHEPPPWLSLALHVETLGAAISELAVKSRPPPLRVADQPLPWSPAAELPIAPVPFPAHSRLEFTGGVLPDTLVQIPTLPSWQSNEAVSNSVVRVAFDQAGRPFSCVLLSKSGLKEADDYALRLATGLRYRSTGLPSHRDARDLLNFGTLIFQWHTVPLPASPSPRGVTSIP